MENKEFEELQAKALEAKKNYEAAQKNLANYQKEAEDKKKAELALQKEKRKKEIETKDKELRDLILAYMKDYGRLEITRNSEDDNCLSPFLSRKFWF